MAAEQTKKTHTLLRSLLLILLAVAVFLLARFLMGTYTMMHLSATDIDHVELVVSPNGMSATSTGDDTAALVNLLRKVSVYYAQDAAVAGQSTALTIFKHDGSQMQVVLCGDHLTMDGKGYKCDAEASQKVLDWANELLAKQ